MLVEQSLADKELYTKISKGLSDICDKQKIGLVKKFNVIVNNDCEISADELYQKLKEELTDIISSTTKIVVERKNIEIFSAIIYKVEGEKTEKV